MFKRETILKVLAAAVVAASLTGCGGGAPTGVEEEWEDTGSGYGTDPTGGMGTGTGQYGGTGGTTGGYGGTTGGYGGGATGGYGGGMAVGGDLTASVVKKKNGTLFGMGKFTCTVEVSNPSSVQKTGTLTVTFKNGSKTSKTAPVSESVSLGPNETKTFEFTDKAWSTDAVEVEVTTDASSAAMPAAGGYGAPTGGYGGAATGAYGAPAAGGYGSTTPTTGYGSTY